MMFNVVLKLFGLREISTKNYSDVQRGTDIIQFERDLDKELYVCPVWYRRYLA